MVQMMCIIILVEPNNVMFQQAIGYMDTIQKLFLHALRESTSMTAGTAGIVMKRQEIKFVLSLGIEFANAGVRFYVIV